MDHRTIATDVDLGPGLVKIAEHWASLCWGFWNNGPADITMNVDVEDAVLSLLKLGDNNWPAAMFMNMGVEDAVFEPVEAGGQ